MGHRFAELLFTPGVQAAQEINGSRIACARMLEGPAHHDVLGPKERAFIAARDSFYMATVSETGWPYVQHRGGQPGFVHVLADKSIGFADYRGNRQYISAGNLASDNRVALFLMDYLHRTRLKILGRVRAVTADDEETLAKLQPSDNRAVAERAFVIDIEAFDWNCPQHITQRYTLAKVEHATEPLRQRIAELERQLAERK